MLISFRDGDNNLCAKNILQLDLDMCVYDNKKGEYKIQLNKNCTYDQVYDSKDEAEKMMKHLVEVSNHLENQLINEAQ